MKRMLVLPIVFLGISVAFAGCVPPGSDSGPPTAFCTARSTSELMAVAPTSGFSVSADGRSVAFVENQVLKVYDPQQSVTNTYATTGSISILKPKLSEDGRTLLVMIGTGSHSFHALRIDRVSGEVDQPYGSALNLLGETTSDLKYAAQTMGGPVGPVQIARLDLTAEPIERDSIFRDDNFRPEYWPSPSALSANGRFVAWEKGPTGGVEDPVHTYHLWDSTTGESVEIGSTTADWDDAGVGGVSNDGTVLVFGRDLVRTTSGPSVGMWSNGGVTAVATSSHARALGISVDGRVSLVFEPDNNDGDPAGPGRLILHDLMTSTEVTVGHTTDVKRSTTFTAALDRVNWIDDAGALQSLHCS